MQVLTKQGRFYISLPNRLYNELAEVCERHGEMNLDLAALILYFILKDGSDTQDYVPLCSTILRQYDHGQFKTSKHIQVLRQAGLLEALNYVHNIKGKDNSCRRFRIPQHYLAEEKGDKSGFFSAVLEVKNEKLLTKINKEHKQSKIAASSSIPHLTEWLNSSGFTIDKGPAIEFIQHHYHRESQKYFNRLDKINNFTPSYSYQRNGKDDRLHSTFTRLPSDLKKFVKYNGQPLVEVDIRSAQPFLLSILLEEFLNHYYELNNSKYGVTKTRLKNRVFKSLNKYINNENKDYNKNNKYVIDTETISIESTIILLETLGDLDFTEIRGFISLVRSGYLYERISELVLSMDLINTRENLYYVNLFDKKDNYQKEFCFEKRECGKELMINALYSKKGRSSIKAVNGIRDLFPSVFLLIDAFKIKAHEDFSLFLQRMEAKCVLDYCAKNIAEEFPYMPLVSRHDSLSTTEEYGEQLFEQFQLLADTYFGTPVQLKEIEFW